MSDWGRAASVMAVLYRGELVALIPTLDNPAPFIGSGYSDVLMPPDTLFACGGLRFCVLGCDPSTLTLQGARVLQSGCDLVIVPACTPVRAGLIDEIRGERRKTCPPRRAARVASGKRRLGRYLQSFCTRAFRRVRSARKACRAHRRAMRKRSSQRGTGYGLIAAQKRVRAGAAPAHVNRAFGPEGELLRLSGRSFLPERDTGAIWPGLFDLQVGWPLVPAWREPESKKLVLGVSGASIPRPSAAGSAACRRRCAGAFP
jgi:NAD+ synthase (glutamine-hydrolysing)